MSSLLSIIERDPTPTGYSAVEKGQRLQLAANVALRKKLNSGEVRYENGRYTFNEAYHVNRPAFLKPGGKKV
ncbi:hypothetical protein [Nissabacter sp. SGAir0207]|uniref:hypothetical protein n=1 Tax=Nissabacter sp. SGAir0207 TaxID=2126321 RepID=UPI0010F65269|nr:hypothetical protein [Nissabacter sp. SGAir0207]